jgi:hypothetical protein
LLLVERANRRKSGSINSMPQRTSKTTSGLSQRSINGDSNMDERSSKFPIESNLADLEQDLFGVLFEFHKKTMDLLRNSGLNDDKLESVSKRIKQLLADATAEMKRTKNLNVSEFLDAAYEDVKNMVDELSDPHDSVESV